MTLRVLGNFDHFRASTLASMAEAIGCAVTNDAPLAIAWLPYGESRPSQSCINRHTDADKRSLAEHFSRVFGYPLGVDTSRFRAQVVCKSPRNGAHDGQILDAPTRQPDASKVYQHLIDNRTRGDNIIDLRVPYIGGIGPICWVKCRPLEQRFASQSVWARLATPDELFNRNECRLITQFCQEIRLEYGELDVLRDVQSDSIYIVDVNPTPYPLTKGIDPPEWTRAVQQMASKFQEVLLS